MGRENTGYEEVMGVCELGDMNENGEKFADMCALNNLVIGGSVFAHRKIHKSRQLGFHQTAAQRIR